MCAFAVGAGVRVDAGVGRDCAHARCVARAEPRAPWCVRASADGGRTSVCAVAVSLDGGLCAINIPFMGHGGESGETGKYPERKRPAHHAPHIRGNRSTIIFLTLCASDRRPLFCRETIHAHLVSVWRSWDYWKVGHYVLMPDHVHLFCAPGRYPPPKFKNWVKAIKSAVTRGWPESRTFSIWQENFWDRQIRSAKDYHERMAYMNANPVRRGLVEDWKDWPYRGKVFDLRWHDA